MMTKEAELYARMPEFRYLVSSSEGFIKWALSQVEKPYVACSFGKDSAVLLDMILKFDSEIQVVFVEYPETELIDNYNETISKWSIKLHRIMLDCGIEDEISEGDAMNEFALTNGLDSSFQGLRMAESNGRRISIKKHGKFAKFSNGLIRICPLSDWSWKDVAAYCITRNLPMLSVYEKIGFEERTVSGIAGTDYGFRESQLAKLRQFDINRFNLLLQKYPQLAKYC